MDVSIRIQKVEKTCKVLLATNIIELLFIIRGAVRNNKVSKFPVGNMNRPVIPVIGDEECRGFYIEVPRPTSEDWGNAEELIASGEYSSMDAYLSDWLAFNPMETRWFYVTSRKHGNNRSIHVTDRKFTHFVISNRSSYNEKEFDNACCKENLTRFFDFLDLMIGVIRGAVRNNKVGKFPVGNINRPVIPMLS